MSEQVEGLGAKEGIVNIRVKAYFYFPLKT